MTLFNEIAAGGQTWAHRTRMLKQVLKIAVICSFLFMMCILSIKIFDKLGMREFKTLWVYVYALLAKCLHIKVNIDPVFWYKVSSSTRSLNVDPDLVLFYLHKPVLNIISFFKVAFFQSFKWGIFGFITMLIFFWIRGKQSQKKEHISGIKILSDLELSLRLKFKFKASDIKLGNIPMLKNSETKHMLICGTTGSGKSNCLMSLLEQIRARGERAVIVDTTGAFVSHFWREEQDILINPYDERSVRWHPWCECSKDYHYEQLVNSFIPNMSYFDNFFPEAGRAVLYSSLRKAAAFGETNIEEFVNMLMRKSPAELHEELQDTDAAIYVDPKGDKTAMSIRMTIVNSVRHFRPLKHTETPFSIRDWILSKEKKDQWLFVACTTEQRRSIQTLMTVWFSVAINAMKARKVEKKTEKIWFIIDELQSLQKLEYLEESLAELRKYGGCIVVATQNISQMDKTYGPHATKTLSDLCGTKICFRQESADIAQRMATFFGEREFKEVQEGLSYGAHEMRDGVNLSKIERLKPTVSSTRILELEDLEAFIKIPGGLPAAKTKFKYCDLQQIAEAFVKKSIKEKK